MAFVLTVGETTSRLRPRQERQRGGAQPGGRLRDAHLLVLAHAHQLAHRRAQHPPIARVPEQLLGRRTCQMEQGSNPTKLNMLTRNISRC